MIGRLLYVALIAIVIRWIWRSFSERVEASVRERSAGDPGPGLYKGLMVRDPICGVHIPESRALVELRAGERLYFCSERCRSALGSSGS
jgi:YHS domain-containing protein